MIFSAGLVLKGTVGLLALGTVSTGTWALISKNLWTKLDHEAFSPKEGSTWNWSSDSTSKDTQTVDEGKPIEIKLSLTGSYSSSPNTKTWKCTITGVPPTSITSKTIKVKDQLDTLISALGSSGSSGSWTPSSDETKKNKIEKFFNSCIKSRSFYEWRLSNWGNNAESTINLPIITESNEIKFSEKEFKSLYE